MRYLIGTILLLTLISCSDQKVSERNVLVFTKTEGYRHNSINDGVSAIKKLGNDYGFSVDHTEDANQINSSNLKKYDAVIFLHTTGNIFNEVQQNEFELYCESGGGFVGIHAASDTEYDWPWYGALVGGYFNGHPNNPNVRNANIQTKEKNHISCRHLEETWNRDDEWYNFKNLNPKMTVLLNLDETSYEGGTNGAYHPISWIHDRGSNRMFYTGMGHTSESFYEEAFLKHLLGGIVYVIGEGSKPKYNIKS